MIKLIPPIFLLMVIPAMAADGLNCNIGPIVKSYGGSPWLVYACDDQRSLVFASAPGSKAMPFYFSLTAKSGGYSLAGEGTGDKRVTDAASHDLSSLKPDEVAKLVSEAQAAGKHK